MASLAATTLLTAGGLGGIALMLWVLHQAGLTMRQAARRLATFLVFLYAVYMAALIVDGPRAIACATGYWAFNLGALWALFRGFGETVPPLVLVQAFFVGMTASLIPLLPGGVGSIDGAG